MINMKLHYKTANWIFLFLYLLPVAAMGLFVQQRVQSGLATAQLFMQNQIDVDRKIIAMRGNLRAVQPAIRQALLDGKEEKIKSAKAFALEKQEDIDNFWNVYESSYSVKERPFLLNILAETQESNLISEEAQTLKSIRRLLDNYFVAVSAIDSNRNLNNNDIAIAEFFNNLDNKREEIYAAFNNLADLRYIFAQRIVFYITSQAGAQEAIFNSIFITLALTIIIIAVFQYFYINRPLGDIMLFLKDIKAGQRRQRLYFSSPIKEIKETEEILNDIIEAAEEHESHEEHK